MESKLTNTFKLLMLAVRFLKKGDKKTAKLLNDIANTHLSNNESIKNDDGSV